MAVAYNHKEIEKKWRENWEKNPVNIDNGKKEKYYCLDIKFDKPTISPFLSLIS